jgi:cell division protein ZapE
MLDVHNSVKILREGGQGKDPLAQIAKDIAKNTRLLCFDEFQVYDIADAMVLSELFKSLFDHGVIIITTSNVAPDDLYKDGLQRARFEPFIPLVKKAMDVVHLDSNTDYRQQALNDEGTYFIERETDMRHLYDKLVNGKKAPSDTLKVKGRKLPIEMALDGIAWTDFTEMCEKPRAAEDYKALCEAYHTVFLNLVPRMGYDRRNEAKRFILLIDTLYDAGMKLVINAEVAPQKLYHGKHHAFEFERTISRLLEMQGEEYLLRTSKDNLDSV